MPENGSGGPLFLCGSVPYKKRMRGKNEYAAGKIKEESAEK
jgi:hypothetical protein